jgi:hypothetical protein
MTGYCQTIIKQQTRGKLVLPALYNLYKLYQITDATKAEAMKKRISAEYPESRYAQIMNNTTAKIVLLKHRKYLHQMV